MTVAASDACLGVRERRLLATLTADDRPESVATSFEVLLVRELGARFAQRKNFVADVQSAVPDFYDHVGQHLKAWQPPAPPLPQEKAQPSDVAPEALRQQADEIALARDE
jgi:hypothetical protein